MLAATCSLVAPASGNAGFSCLGRGLETRLTPPEQKLTWEESLQEIAWDARAAGKGADANALEARLAHELETEPLVMHRALRADQGKGANRSLLGRFRSGLSAIMKASSANQTPGAEVAAYRLSRLLGFDFVPVTVERTIGRVKHSVQYFCKGLHRLWGFSSSDRELRGIFFFDFLIANGDRTPENLLVRSKPGATEAGARQHIAIDNGDSFPSATGSVGYLSDPQVLKQFLPAPEVFARFLAASPQEIRRTIEPWVGAQATNGVLARRQAFLDALRAAQAQGHFGNYPRIP